MTVLQGVSAFSPGILPRFSGVTYVGSKPVSNGEVVQPNDFPKTQTTIHSFKVDGPDVEKYKFFLSQGDVVQLIHTNVRSPYPGDIRSGMDNVTEAVVNLLPGDPDNFQTVQMLLGPDDVNLVNQLVQDAQEPPKDKVGGKPNFFLGPLDPTHKPHYHTDFPQLELFDLRSVKSNIQRGLASNLFKQYMSMAMDTQPIIGLLSDQIKKLINKKPTP